MANSSSEDEANTLPERPTKIQPYQFEMSGRILKEYRNIMSASKQNTMRYSMGFAKSLVALTEVLTAQMGVMRRSKKVSSFELYKLNPLLPHCRSIARELVHFYTGSQLRIVTVRGNTVGRHS